MCNGICKNILIPPYFADGSMYAKGFVYCMSGCNCYFDPKDCVKKKRLLCPCCGYPIRTRPRDKKKMVVVRIE